MHNPFLFYSDANYVALILKKNNRCNTYKQVYEQNCELIIFASYLKIDLFYRMYKNHVINSRGLHKGQISFFYV